MRDRRFHFFATAVVAAALFFGATPSADAHGVLVPADPKAPPLRLENQRVDVVVRDQAAETKLNQEFVNDTDQVQEAVYLFPLPKGAAVRSFAMWVDGKRLDAELLAADKARAAYEDVVRRLKDPGLLEFLGNDVWRVRVYPIPPRGRQKMEISYTEI
ncbi:MAG: VIT domain-containing protein, partial [Planctomycetia bacterium]